MSTEKVNYAVVDTETTGFDPAKGDRVIEVAVAIVEDGQVTQTWSSLVNPGAGVSPGATHIHRITREMLDKAPTFAQIAGELIALLQGKVLVAHNMRFDSKFLEREFKLIGVEMPKEGRMCTLEGSRYLMPAQTSHRLGDLCEVIGVDLDGWHAAEADAVAAAKIHLHLLSLAPALRVQAPDADLWPDLPNHNAALPRVA